MTSKIHFSLGQFVSMVLLFCCVIEQPTAFTIELIHRYAPRSPFYNANLTHQEIVERLNFQTRSRKQQTDYINSIRKENGTLIDLHAIRPSLDFDNTLSAFLVEVSLGTLSSRWPSYKSYYLDLDTGNDLTWLQCEDCERKPHHCYRQIEPPFPNSNSRSYKPLPCGKHSLCYPHQCIGESCSYHNIYVDNSHSKGVLARENFAFPSSTKHEKTVSFVFGCGIDNKRLGGEEIDLKAAGVFGLGWGPHSFVSQQNFRSQGRFSYCLPSVSQAAKGLSIFLRFGSDIPSYSTLPRTRLIKYQDENAYYVNLLDMGINGARLNIPSRYFQKRELDVGGCSFDTGSTLTSVSSPAYQMVKEAVERHIASSMRSLENVGEMFGFDLCYRALKPFTGHNNLPSITFHFEGNVDLVVKPENAFHHDSRYIDHEYICLAMIPRERTVISSSAQANHLIVYDLHGQSIYIGPRDCSRNP